MGQTRCMLDDQEFNIFRTVMNLVHKSDESKFAALAKVNVLINQHYPDRSVADIHKEAGFGTKVASGCHWFLHCYVG